MTQFAPPYEDILRRQLHSAASAYIAMTGTTETAFSKTTVGDGSFLARWRRGEGSFRVATYDEIMAHISHLWPPGVDWPADIPRPAPKQLIFKPKPRRAKSEENASGEEAVS
jgi:hypothetical protein